MNLRVYIALTVVTSVLLLICTIAMVKVWLKLKEMRSSVAGLVRTNMVYYENTRKELENVQSNVEARVKELSAELLYLSDELAKYSCDTSLGVGNAQYQDVMGKQDKISDEVEDQAVHSGVRRSVIGSINTALESSKESLGENKESGDDISEVPTKPIVENVKAGSSRDQSTIPRVAMQDLSIGSQDLEQGKPVGSNVTSKLSSIELRDVNNSKPINPVGVVR
ncbi:hypothetical protein EDL79_03965 [Ehrlichia ruminantium]|uniref:Uncharacterized protein n=1 Tax=Ehrlichia ruminantium TaxID=779 RepID=A0AAE6Q9D3_EHRRU|nr:hypothetical protein [Ehrlichia ruminantium]QGR02772.1 hypothetical protein EDL81_03955 [Ehrlichia ruminantium]QGR03692.1 hypothetical protein EDL80_03955 [Ehrlichia ruminantium]QGR04619.1 hypothetical protein EDL79_03965 [Ehrlichia ruminantium]